MSDDDRDTRKVAAEILDRCMAGRVRRLARKVDRIYNRRLRELGLRNTQLTLLAMVGYLRRAVPTELADRLGMDKSTLSRTLARMQEAGWIIQEEGPQRHEVRLTPDGERKLVEGREVWRRAQRRAAAELGEDRLESLRRLLDAMEEGG